MIHDFPDVLANSRIQCLEVGIHELLVSFPTYLIEGPTHVGHLWELCVNAPGDFATLTDMRVCVSVTTVLQTPTTELAWARAAADVGERQDRNGRVGRLGLL